jgi:HD-GYP domain-containing protein (c-di-GMP phosphodiesterase class II)
MTLAALPPASPSVRSLVESLQAGGLAEHGARVASTSAELCRRLGISRRPTAVVTMAALLHDVGRLGPPGRAGRVALRSEEVLRDVEGLRAAAVLVRHVHERWDGRGGPDGLKRDRIPLGSRIIGVCDAWDTISTCLSQADAIATMRAGAGAQWDPRIVNALIAHVSNGSAR